MGWIPECYCSRIPFLDAFHLVKEACPYKVDRAGLGVTETWVQVPLPWGLWASHCTHGASVSNLSNGEKTLSSPDSGEDSMIPGL